PEELLAVGDAVALARLVEPSPSPGLFATLHDEGAGPGVKGIGMRLEKPVLVAPEDKGEGVQRQVGAEPDVLRGVQYLGRPEDFSVGLAHPPVDPVGAHQQVGLPEGRQVANFLTKDEVDAQLAGASLQDVEQDLARDAGEDVTAGTDPAVRETDVNRVLARTAGSDH